jgi:hypothetical protein
MDAPKCKTCGKRHWGKCLEPISGVSYGAHTIHGIEPSHTVLNVDPKQPIVVHFSGGSVTLKSGEMLTFDPLGKPVVSTKVPFDRTAYQREYMRKRRAKERRSL